MGSFSTGVGNLSLILTLGIWSLSFSLPAGPSGRQCCRVKLSLRWATQSRPEIGTWLLHTQAAFSQILHNTNKTDILSGDIFVCYVICGTKDKMKITTNFRMDDGRALNQVQGPMLFTQAPTPCFNLALWFCIY